MSVVALPTSVSVAAGSVSVVVPATADACNNVEPEVEPVCVVPPLNVLFESVCVPVNVATVLSIAIVTAPEPSNDVPESPVPIVKAFVVDDLIVIAEDPSNATPLMFTVDASLVAVEALPVSAPVNPVEVTDVKPARVVDEAPSAIAVVPIVVVLFVRAAFEIFDNVLVEPDMLLFVKVSVVARPINVSVDVGNVNVPVLLIDAITGAVNVSPATVEAVAPSATFVEPIVTDEFESLLFAIDPASIVFVTVAVSA